MTATQKQTSVPEEVISMSEAETVIRTALSVPQTVERVSKTGEVTTVTLPAIDTSRHEITARELWLYCVGTGKPINRIDSYKALLKYVAVDYRHIFKPDTKGENSGIRYFVRVDNVIQFYYLLMNSQLTINPQQ